MSEKLMPDYPTTKEELDSHQRHFLEKFFQTFQAEGTSEEEREHILEIIRVFVFYNNEKSMNRIIEELREKDAWWSVWSDFEGDRDGLIEMIQMAKELVEGSLKELFITYLFEVFELEEALISYSLALEQSDQILNRLINRLNHYNSQTKSQMATKLRANRLRQVFWTVDDAKYYRIKSILADLVPMVFPNEEDLHTTVSEIERNHSGQITMKIATRVSNFLRQRVF